jgi:hypothetical protein
MDNYICQQHNESATSTPSIPVLRAQFTNHAIPKYIYLFPSKKKYIYLLGILAFKIFN